MSDSLESMAGVVTDRRLPFLWILGIGAPVAIIIAVPLGVGLLGFPAASELMAIATLLGVLLILQLIVFLAVLNRWRPRAIQVGSAGVGIRKLFGKDWMVPWSRVSVTYGRPRGFGILHDSSRPQSLVFLTQEQYVAVNSSPFLVVQMLQRLP